MTAMRFTKLDYCQYLLSSQINYTLTNLADYLETVSHDRINRYLSREKLTPRLLWEQVKPIILAHENAYIIFDDTVLDKRYAENIQLIRRQYSGASRSEGDRHAGGNFLIGESISKLKLTQN